MNVMSTLNTLLVQAQLGWRDPSKNRDHLQSLLAGADGDFDPQGMAQGLVE